LRRRPTTGNSNMAAKTGSTYISGTRIDSAKIPTTTRGFLIVASSQKVLPNVSDNDEQPKVAMWPPKPDILIALATLSI